MNPPKVACKVLSFLVFSAAVSLGFGQNFPVTQASTPPNVDLKDVKFIQRLGNQLPLDVPFKDQDGSDVSLRTVLHGKPAILLAIFYRCTGVCSLELDNVVGVLTKLTDKRVGKDYDVIVLGIDPKETPDLAKAKLAQILATSPKLKGTNKGWHLLTGSLNNIRTVTGPMGFFFTYDESKDRVNHPAGLSFITPSGVVSSYILGARYAPDVVSMDLATAAKNQIGVKSQDIFFGCIHIDPLTGHRSIVIQNVLKVAGIVTVIALSLMLLTLTGKARWGKGAPPSRDDLYQVPSDRR